MYFRLQELRYKKTDGDEVEDLEKLLMAVKQKHPDINAVSSGAIASNYQRLRVESICSRLGLISLAYMWEQDQATLLQNMVSTCFPCMCSRLLSIYFKVKFVLDCYAYKLAQGPVLCQFLGFKS